MANAGDAGWQPNDEPAAVFAVAPSQPQAVASQQPTAGTSSQQDQAAAWPPGPGPLAGVLASLPQPRDMQPDQPQAVQLPAPQPGGPSLLAADQQAAAAPASSPAEDGTSPPPLDWHQHDAWAQATEPASASGAAAAAAAWPPPDEQLVASAAVVALEAEVPVVDAAALDAEAPPPALGQQLASCHQAAVAHQAWHPMPVALVSAPRFQLRLHPPGSSGISR